MLFLSGIYPTGCITIILIHTFQSRDRNGLCIVCFFSFTFECRPPDYCWLMADEQMSGLGGNTLPLPAIFINTSTPKIPLVDLIAQRLYTFRSKPYATWSANTASISSDPSLLQSLDLDGLDLLLPSTSRHQTQGMPSLCATHLLQSFPKSLLSTKSRISP